MSLTVTPSPGETMVYDVQSASRPSRTYRVEMLANGGAGQCACTDWNIRRWPNIKAGIDPFTREGYCKHICAARYYFLRQLLKRMAEAEDVDR